MKALLLVLAVSFQTFAQNAAPMRTYHDPQNRFAVALPNGWTATAAGQNGEGGVRLSHGSSWGIIGPFHGVQKAEDVADQLGNQLYQQYRNATVVNKSYAQLSGQRAAVAILKGTNPQGTDVVQ